MDVSMPYLDGVGLCRRMRERGHMEPVLFLTARTTIEDRVTGLDAGGDDYLTKPFSIEELLARLRALLRRPPVELQTTGIQIGDLTIDEQQRRCWYPDAAVELTKIEFDLLLALATNKQVVIERTRLYELVWGYELSPASRTLDATIGIHSVTGEQQVYLGNQWFTVIGILDEFQLNPDLDRAALIGLDAAGTYLDADNVPTSILVRVDPDQVESVLDVLARTTNPQNPEEVDVARPTDALEARESADDALTSLFLGLGAVALLVGGVGIANMMVISVLERRAEIGLRRALGATKRHVAIQFLGEALLLSALGGVGGVALGLLATNIYASLRGWDTIVPAIAIYGGLGSALVIGAIAGLYPAIRAARLSPTEALRS